MKLFSALMIWPAVWAGTLVPVSLECEARRDPVGVGTAAPRLGWRLTSKVNGDRQTAYQIVAASSAALLEAGKGDLWDSGRVASGETEWIEYAGKPLEPFARVHWKVRVWDAAGAASDWSGPARFTVALTEAAQWRGSWISSPDFSLRPGPLPLFRKEFTLAKPVRAATALVSGAGFHELHLNGAKVGDHVLAPAWSNFRATMYYEAHDVTRLLKQGANAVGVMVGNGFYNVPGGRYTKFTSSFGHPRVALMLHLEYEDGTSGDVVSDASWRVTDGPIVFTCIFGGEDYDARRETPGWDTAGFDDSAWQRARGLEPPGGAMRAQMSPPLKVQQSYRPVKVTAPKPGVSVYDLGQNFAGWPVITVSGAAGTHVKLTPGELLTPDGLANQRSSGGPHTYTYTLKGAGRETWSPRFTYYGFRYVQVEGDAKVEDLKGEFIHLDARRSGAFKCSNERLNAIHALIDAAVRSNLQHVVTDCPHREKLGWLEQTYLMGPSMLYNWDLRSFLPKMLADVREAQTTSGLIPDIAPEYVSFRGGFRDSPEWGGAGVFVPWLAWQWYGDKRTLADSYPSMKAYVDYLARQAKDGLLSYGLGDWYDIGPGAPGRSQLTPLGVTATATFYEAERIVAEAARVLGHPAEAAKYAARAAATRAAFQKAYYKPAEKTYATSSQASLAMPLALGLAPLADRGALIDRLEADIRGRGNHTSAGDIGYRYVLAALAEAGRTGVVFDMANNETAPSYYAQLKAGATSLTEAWDGNTHSSQNHLMLGHIDEWFYSGLAGIRQDRASAGMTKLIIEPVPAGDLEWVMATVGTPRGPVTVHWRIEGGKLILDVDLPPGVTARTRLPGLGPRLLVSGHHMIEAPYKKQ